MSAVPNQLQVFAEVHQHFDMDRLLLDFKDRLSPMEEKCLQGVLLGKPPREIARLCGIKGKDPGNVVSQYLKKPRDLIKNLLTLPKDQVIPYGKFSFLLKDYRIKGNYKKIEIIELPQEVDSMANSSIENINFKFMEDIEPYIESFYKLLHSENYIDAFYTIFDTVDHENCVYKFLSSHGYLNIVIALYEQLIKSWVPRKGEKWEFLTALTCLGDANDRMGNHEIAIDHYQNCLKIALEIDDVDNIGGSLVNLGLAYYSLTNYEEALDCSRRGLEIAREIGNREFEAHALNNLGMIYSDLEEYQLAIDYYHFSLEVKSKAHDTQGEAGSLINIGNTYRQLQQYEQGIYYLQRGIEAAHQSHHNQFEANGWFNLALALESLHQYSDALSAYEKAFTLYQQMEMIENVEDCRNAITQITKAIKDGISDFIANGCNTDDFENDNFEDDLDAETSHELDDEADDDFDRE